MKVAPKLSLNATLSSIADRKSIPFTYLCILEVGIMLYPLEAMNLWTGQSAFLLYNRQLCLDRPGRQKPTFQIEVPMFWKRCSQLHPPATLEATEYQRPN